DMRAYTQVVHDLEQSKSELQEKILDLEKFEEVVVGRELKMIALEKELESLRKEVERLRAGRICTRWRRPRSRSVSAQSRSPARPRRPRENCAPTWSCWSGACGKATHSAARCATS